MVTTINEEGANFECNIPVEAARAFDTSNFHFGVAATSYRVARRLKPSTVPPSIRREIENGKHDTKFNVTSQVLGAFIRYVAHCLLMFQGWSLRYTRSWCSKEGYAHSYVVPAGLSVKVDLS